MWEWLRAWWRRRMLRRLGLPETIRGYSCWADWCQAKYSKERPRRYLMPYLDEAGRYVRHDVGGVVPMIVLQDGRLAFYRIERIHRPGPFYDGVLSDDGMSYDLAFAHLEGGGRA
jgi:hypothetical protein